MTQHPTSVEAGRPYAGLSPDRVLSAVDAAGYCTTGSLLPLNSYENRVYQLGLEDGDFLIAKFYRPDRLTSDAIEEEHQFLSELHQREIPVVAPLSNREGQSLFHHQGFRFALFPRKGGRFPDLEDPDRLFRIGRLLGMMHSVGATRSFEFRGALEQVRSPRAAAEYLLQQGFIPPEHRQRYAMLSQRLLDEIDARLAHFQREDWIRLHGDFHPGNLLQRDERLVIVDTDDCCMGPAVQDVWLLLSGDRNQMRAQLAELIEGYEEFFEFDLRQLALIESLRSLRILYYAAWLARRWTDPAFPRHFPWFNQGTYWDEQMQTLQEQVVAMEVPALELG